MRHSHRPSAPRGYPPNRDADTISLWCWHLVTTQMQNTGEFCSLFCRTKPISRFSLQLDVKRAFRRVTSLPQRLQTTDQSTRMGAFCTIPVLHGRLNSVTSGLSNSLKTTCVRLGHSFKYDLYILHAVASRQLTLWLHCSVSGRQLAALHAETWNSLFASILIRHWSTI